MRKRRRQLQDSRIYPQESRVYFNIENEFSQKCAICHRRGHTFVRPCQCNVAYHQQCLLLYIQRRILHELRYKEEMDVSQLKCISCKHRLYILFSHEVQRNCSTLCRKLSRNCCNKHVVLLVIFLVLIIITACTAGVLLTAEKGKVSDSTQYGLASALAIEVLIFLAILYSFLQTYLTTKEFVIQKAYDMTDLRSMQSQNSDDNIVNDEQYIVIKN